MRWACKLYYQYRMQQLINKKKMKEFLRQEVKNDI